MRVCSLWHRLTLNTPSLWRVLIVDTTLWPGTGRSAAALTALVRKTLERSGNHPIRVEIAVSNTLVDVDVMNLLTAHSRRWTHFTLWTDVYSDYDPFRLLLPVKGNIPLLRFLEIITQWEEQDWDAEYRSLFAAAPSLTRFYATAPCERITDVPWPHLKLFQWTLDYKKLTNDALAFLTRLPTPFVLLMVDVPDTIHVGEIPRLGHHVLSDVLQGLTLVISDGVSCMERVLHALTSPGLRSFAVKGRFEDPANAIWWDRDALLPFIFRSKLASSLRFLEVSRVLITADELLECLQNLPLLEDLLLAEGNDDLDDFFITDDLLVGLVVVDLVPRLTFLCLTSHIVFSEHSLEQLVLGRVRRPVQAETTGDFDLMVFHLPESLGALSTELLERMQNLERETEFEFQFTYAADPDFL